MVCQPGFCLYADLFSIKNDKAVVCKVHHWSYPSPTWSPIAFSISGARKKKPYEVVSDRLNLKHSPQDRLACRTVNLSCIEVWLAVCIQEHRCGFAVWIQKNRCGPAVCILEHRCGSAVLAGKHQSKRCPCASSNCRHQPWLVLLRMTEYQECASSNCVSVGTISLTKTARMFVLGTSNIHTIVNFMRRKKRTNCLYSLLWDTFKTSLRLAIAASL